MTDATDDDRDLVPFAAHLQGLAVGAMVGVMLGLGVGPIAVIYVGVPGIVVLFAAYAIERRERAKQSDDTANGGENE